MKNISIKAKLLTCFLAIAVSAGIIGIIGITQIDKLNNADKEMFVKVVRAMSDLNQLTSTFN